MQQLKRYYRKNGYDYHQVCRSHHTAMYRQADGQRTVAFEVGYIKRQEKEAILPNGQVSPAGERFWANEDIGRTAWSMVDRDRALQRYHELTAAAARRQQQQAAGAADNNQQSISTDA